MWPSEIGTILEPILTEALTVSRAEKENIQLFDVASGCLTIEAQHGFDAAFSLHSSQSKPKMDARVAGLSGCERLW